MPERRPEPVDVKRVDPDPSITSAIGRNHSLATAVADLVDNSIDAGAKHVLVRFVQRERRAAGLLVVDDGCGMDATTIDDAMGYARRREYEEGDLGHFGIGLKAASLSQADTLWVWSRHYGCPPVGRGLDRSTLDTGPMVQTFATDEAATRLDAVEGFEGATATVVEWRDVRGFLQSPDEDQQRQWLEQSIEDVRKHLGLVLHRILAAGRVRIVVDQVDEVFGPGSPRVVGQLDPFGYHASGKPGYPRLLEVTLDGRATAGELCIWPHAPGSPEWQLAGRPPGDTQGLYVYRHDRLLQAGGWCGLAQSSRDLNPARVALDIDDVFESHVRINPEKTGVVLDADFVQAWNHGRTAVGTTFQDYLSDVRTEAAAARSRQRRPVEVAQPRRGFASTVREAFEDNATFVVEGVAVDLRWRGLMDDEVFRVDHEENTVWLNTRYRSALGGDNIANEDAQVTKVLLHLLVGELAVRTAAGPKAKQDVQAWNAILLAAVQDTERRHARPPGRHSSPNTTTEDDE